jgi:hypothetical protein
LKLNSTPLTIVAAQGVGTAIEVISTSINLTYNSAAYATNTTIQVESNGATTPQFRLLNGINQTISSHRSLGRYVSANTETQIIENADLMVTVASGDPTAGDSDITVSCSLQNNKCIMANKEVAFKIVVDTSRGRPRNREVIKSVEELRKANEKMAEQIKNGFKAAEKGTKGFGASIGGLLKSLGLIGVAMAVFEFMKDIIMKNQKVADALGCVQNYRDSYERTVQSN